jgi:hypothetical protein
MLASTPPRFIGDPPGIVSVATTYAARPTCRPRGFALHLLRADPERLLPTGREPVEGTDFDFLGPRGLGNARIAAHRSPQLGSPKTATTAIANAMPVKKATQAHLSARQASRPAINACDR